MISNLIVIQGEDFSKNFPAIDADETFETSCSIMILGEEKDNLSVSINSDGIINISLGDQETLSLDPSVVYYYRIRLESISGTVSFPFEGTIRVIPTITRNQENG